MVNVYVFLKLDYYCRNSAELEVLRLALILPLTEHLVNLIDPDRCYFLLSVPVEDCVPYPSPHPRHYPKAIFSAWWYCVQFCSYFGHLKYTYAHTNAVTVIKLYPCLLRDVLY